MYVHHNGLLVISCPMIFRVDAKLFYYFIYVNMVIHKYSIAT